MDIIASHLVELADNKASHVSPLTMSLLDFEVWDHYILRHENGNN